MERWDGTVLDINATCSELGPQCLQLLGMHALSVSVITDLTDPFSSCDSKLEHSAD